jgi:hypothetical protein
MVNMAGTYTVQVSTNGICYSPPSNAIQVTTSSNIPQPSITLIGDDYFCQGELALLTGPGGFAGYLWSNGDTTQNITLTQSGTYTLIVRNAEGCQSNPSSGIAITVLPRPPAPVVTPSGTLTLCAGNVVLSATGLVPGSIIWTNGINGTNLVVSLPGVYRAVLLSAEGCFGDTSEAVIVVQGTVPPIPLITASGQLTLCEGETLTLTGPTGNFSYQWSNGSTSNVITIGSAGSYYLTISSSDDCASTSDTLIVSLSDKPTITSVFQQGDSLQSTTLGATQFTWLLNGVVLAFNSASIPVQGEGLYQLVVRNAANCASDTFLFNLVSIQSYTAGWNLKVYPIPFKDQLHVQMPHLMAGKIELIDALGKTVAVKVVQNGANYMLDTREIPSGVYLLIFTGTSDRKIMRVVK